jgi:Ser/Thr protein kinase RdoA (MazF antagonist)
VKLPLLNDFEKYFNDPLWIEVAKHICLEHGITPEGIRRAEHGENIVFLIGEKFVLKIYTPQRNGFRREQMALEFAEGKTNLVIPEIVEHGEIEGYYDLILTQVTGDVMTREQWLTLDRGNQTALVTQLATGLKKLHSHDASEIGFDWTEFLKIHADYTVERQKAAGANPEWIERLPKYIEENLPLLPKIKKPAFLHGDVHFGNLLMTGDNSRRVISGLFDFADSLAGFHEYDFVAPGVLMIQGQGELQREFFRAYGYADSEMDEELRRRLMLLTILYECSNLKKYALRLRPEAVNYTLEELERAIWNFV